MNSHTLQFELAVLQKHLHEGLSAEAIAKSLRAPVKRVAQVIDDYNSVSASVKKS